MAEEHAHGGGGSGQEFTFLVTGLLSGMVIAEVDLQSMNWTEVLNRPGSGGATARIEANSTTDENFLSWGNALWVLKGDQVLFGGVIGAVQPRADSRVLNIPVHGFMEYYRTQPIQITIDGSSPGYVDQFAYGVGTGVRTGIFMDSHKAGVKFTQVDQFRIFEDLIMHVGRRDPLSNIRPLVTYDALSGILRDDIWYNYEYKMVGTACEQLADRENGFFWHTHFYLDNNSPAFNFQLHLPTVGVNSSSAIDRPIIFDWDADVEETILTAYDFGGEERPESSVIAVGEGEGAGAIVARKDAIADSLGAYTSGRPRYYTVLNYNDVKIQSTLLQHAVKRWNRHKVPFKAAHVSMWNPEDEYMEWDLGDTASLRINDHGIKVFDKYRLTTRNITISKEGDMQVEMDMEEPFVVFEGE
jgi:hypothetical protein